MRSNVQKYHHFNHERNVEIREWCDAKVGRTTKLSMILYGNDSTVSMIKTGKRLPSLLNMQTLRAAMLHIEKIENDGLKACDYVKTAIAPINNIMDPVVEYNTLHSLVDDWIKNDSNKDKKIKIRMFNICYLVNIGWKGDTLYYSVYLNSKNNNPSKSKTNVIFLAKKCIAKVDEMIASGNIWN